MKYTKLWEPTFPSAWVSPGLWLPSCPPLHLALPQTGPCYFYLNSPSTSPHVSCSPFSGAPLHGAPQYSPWPIFVGVAHKSKAGEWSRELKRGIQTSQQDAQGPPWFGCGWTCNCIQLTLPQASVATILDGCLSSLGQPNVHVSCLCKGPWPHSGGPWGSAKGLPRAGQCLLFSKPGVASVMPFLASHWTLETSPTGPGYLLGCILICLHSTLPIGLEIAGGKQTASSLLLPRVRSMHSLCWMNGWICQCPMMIDREERWAVWCDLRNHFSSQKVCAEGQRYQALVIFWENICIRLKIFLTIHESMNSGAEVIEKTKS